MMLPKDQTLDEVELEEYASYACNTFPSPLDPVQRFDPICSAVS